MKLSECFITCGTSIVYCVNHYSCNTMPFHEMRTANKPHRNELYLSLFVSGVTNDSFGEMRLSYQTFSKTIA